MMKIIPNPTPPPASSVSSGTTNKPFRALIVGDYGGDGGYLAKTLRLGGLSSSETFVGSLEAMLSALAREPWDIILADCDFPNFNPSKALNALKDFDVPPPFIVVSNDINDKVVAKLAKAGAAGFVDKSQNENLVPAVERVLREAEANHKKRLADTALRESEERFRLVTEMMPMAILITRFSDSTVLYANPQAGPIFGLSSDAMVGLRVLDLCPSSYKLEQVAA